MTKEETPLGRGAESTGNAELDSVLTITEAKKTSNGNPVNRSLNPMINLEDREMCLKWLINNITKCLKAGYRVYFSSILDANGCCMKCGSHDCAHIEQQLKPNPGREISLKSPYELRLVIQSGYLPGTLPQFCTHKNGLAKIVTPYTDLENDKKLRGVLEFIKESPANVCHFCLWVANLHSIRPPFSKEKVYEIFNSSRGERNQ